MDFQWSGGEVKLPMTLIFSWIVGGGGGFNDLTYLFSLFSVNQLLVWTQLTLGDSGGGKGGGKLQFS